MPHAKVNGVNIYYEVQGEGEPLVLVPGLGSDLTRWYRNLPGLEVERSFRRLRSRQEIGGLSSEDSGGSRGRSFIRTTQE